MQRYDLLINIYWVTQSGYFRFSTTVGLDMGITYGTKLFCHRISEEIRINKITIKEYNDRTVYGLFRNPFLVDCGIPALDIPTTPRPQKISRYTAKNPPGHLVYTIDKSGIYWRGIFLKYSTDGTND